MNTDGQDVSRQQLIVVPVYYGLGFEPGVSPGRCAARQEKHRHCGRRVETLRRIFSGRPGDMKWERV